jgi:hypothetical protein
VLVLAGEAAALDADKKAADVICGQIAKMVDAIFGTPTDKNR